MTDHLGGLRVLLFLFVLGVALPAHSGEQRALVIGINQYVIPGVPLVPRGDPPDTRGWLNLDGAVNDAKQLRDILIARYGFKRDHVDDLFDQEATREKILQAIDKLVEQTEEGDTAFFYYAGHGSRVRNTLSSESDKLDESLVPADAARGALDIRDKELADRFNKILDANGSVIVVLDSCHSGSATRGPGGISPATTRMIPFDPRDVRDGKVRPEIWKRGAVVLSATQKDQLANEHQDDFGIDSGVFTTALLRALRTSELTEPVQNLHRRIYGWMRSTNFRQDPGIEATDERKRQSLFGEAGSENVGRTVAAVQGVTGEIIILQEGIAVSLISPRKWY